MCNRKNDGTGSSSCYGWWLLLLMNYPIGAIASVRIEPFVLGMPFSVFYFWAAYSVLILAGVVLAWKVMRD